MSPPAAGRCQKQVIYNLSLVCTSLPAVARCCQPATLDHSGGKYACATAPPKPGTRFTNLVLFHCLGPTLAFPRHPPPWRVLQGVRQGLAPGWRHARRCLVPPVSVPPDRLLLIWSSGRHARTRNAAQHPQDRCIANHLQQDLLLWRSARAEVGAAQEGVDSVRAVVALGTPHGSVSCEEHGCALRERDRRGHRGGRTQMGSLTR